MATIRCKGCGALYNYDKEGCCPKCGAYNRPPARERVNADGTVRHMDDASFARHGGGSGKVCFEEKECYERKECHEQDARQYRTVRSQSGGQGAAPSFAAAQSQRRQAQGAARRVPLIGVSVVVLVVLSMAFNLVNSIRSGWDEWSGDGDEGNTSYAEWMGEWDVDGVMGEEIPLSDGTTLCVSQIRWDEDAGEYLVKLERTYPADMTEEACQEADEALDVTGLYCADGNSYYVFPWHSVTDGEYAFRTEEYTLLPDHMIVRYEPPMAEAQTVYIAVYM